MPFNTPSTMPSIQLSLNLDSRLCGSMAVRRDREVAFPFPLQPQYTGLESCCEGSYVLSRCAPPPPAALCPFFLTFHSLNPLTRRRRRTVACAELSSTASRANQLLAPWCLPPTTDWRRSPIIKAT